MSKKYKKGEAFKSLKELMEYFIENDKYFFINNANVRDDFPSCPIIDLTTDYDRFFTAIEVVEEKLYQVMYKRRDNDTPIFARYAYSSKKDFIKYDSVYRDYEWIKLKEVNLEEWK